MKIIPFPKALLAAAAVSLGFFNAARAADETTPPAPAAAPVDAGHGLLGQTYFNLGYTYTDGVEANPNASTFSFGFNQGVRAGLDTLLEYSYMQSENTGFGRIDEQIFDVGARAFTNYNGFKPYAEAGLGGAWLKTPAVSHERSFLFFVGAGVELPATTELTFTPFVRLTYANSLDDHKIWNYGVRGNYWLTERLALTGSLSRDNSRDTGFGIGVNIRY